MADAVPAPIRTPTPADEPALLALNHAHATELSPLDAGGLRALLAKAFAARVVGEAEALLIAFDQDAAYDSPNVLWLKARYARFVYVDRIVVSPAARRGGHARRLYEHLFALAADAGHPMVCCEVNSDPPNPLSDAFHARLGFAVVGEERIAQYGKTVRYLVRPL
jgi:predicted GNAT superfamily acetyltransferase